MFMDKCCPSVCLVDQESVTLRGCRFARARKDEIPAHAQLVDEDCVFNDVVEFTPDDVGEPARFDDEEPPTKTRKASALMIAAYGASLVALIIGVARFLVRHKKRLPTSDQEKLVGGQTYREPD
jgi:hypothetical protein